MLSSGAVYLRTSVDDNAAAAFIYMSVERVGGAPGARTHTDQTHQQTARPTELFHPPTGNFISKNIAHHRLICVSACDCSSAKTDSVNFCSQNCLVVWFFGFLFCIELFGNYGERGLWGVL
jgi:hypothetical protein